MNDKLIKVGTYDLRFNEILGLKLEELDIYRSTGLQQHLIKRKHIGCLKYIESITDMLENPDFVGVNPNEKHTESFELVKRYDENIVLGVKLSVDSGYLYVSTIYEIQESKIARRLHSGRLHKVIDKN
jgi:hypothetical protein